MFWRCLLQYKPNPAKMTRSSFTSDKWLTSEKAGVLFRRDMEIFTRGQTSQIVVSDHGFLVRSTISGRRRLVKHVRGVKSLPPDSFLLPLNLSASERVSAS